MNNWKRVRTESGQLERSGSRFWGEPDFGKLAGKQEPVGFGMTGSNRRTGSSWCRFQGNKFPDSPPSPHICASAI